MTACMLVFAWLLVPSVGKSTSDLDGTCVGDHCMDVDILIQTRFGVKEEQYDGVPVKQVTDAPTVKKVFTMMPRGTAVCPNGKRIASQEECYEAWRSIESIDSLSNIRGMQSGDWEGVPVDCSVQYEGGVWDQAPHWNKRANTDNSRVTSGEFRIICKASEVFTMMPRGTTVCPNGKGIASPEECDEAYLSIKSENSLSNSRGMQSGDFAGVPVDCSVQYDGGAWDQAPHWNVRANTDNSRVTSGEFRIICKTSEGSRCQTSADCGANLFCAVKCFKGNGCPLNQDGRFCQKCAECHSDSDAVDNSCARCQAVNLPEGSQCQTSTECEANLFCAVQCFQGIGCPLNQEGRFCQKCAECHRDSDAVDNSCARCQATPPPPPTPAPPAATTVRRRRTPMTGGYSSIR